jgi:hypothetical protein
LTEIPRIGVNSIGIEPVRTYIINAPTINTPNVPVVLPMGFPVVNIPGCVEARRSNENENLVTNDPDGNLILCDAQYPSYDAMNFTYLKNLSTQKKQNLNDTNNQKPLQHQKYRKQSPQIVLPMVRLKLGQK